MREVVRSQRASNLQLKNWSMCDRLSQNWSRWNWIDRRRSFRQSCYHHHDLRHLFSSLGCDLAQ